jgi:heme/copper-type cytochrome/quinol oxidase subunit 1
MFTMYGTTMIFVAMLIVLGFANHMPPLRRGATWRSGV